MSVNYLIRTLRPFVFPSVFAGIILFSFFDRGGIPFLSHAVLIIGVFAAVLASLFYKEEGKRTFTLPEIFYFLFVSAFTLSFLFSNTPSYGLTEFFSVMGGWIFFTLAASGIFPGTNPKMFKRSGIALLAFSIVIGVVTYIYFPADRFTGPFMNFSKLYEVYPNDYASFLLLFLPFIFPLFFDSKERAERLFYAIILSAALGAFFLTLSRGALVAFIIAFNVMLGFALAYRKTFFFSRTFISRLILVVFLSILSASALLIARSNYQRIANFSERTAIGTYEGGSGIKERFEFWNAAIEISKEHPILGTGPASFKFFFPRHQKTFGIIQDQPHNFFIRLLSENGAPAFIFFILMLVSVIFPAAALLKSEVGFPWALFFSLTAVLAANLFDDTFNFVSTGVPFSIFLGYFAAKTKQFSVWRIEISQKIYKTGLVAISGLLVLIAVHEVWYNIPFREGKALFTQGEFLRSVEKLENSRSLFWERDLSVYLANVYEALSRSDVSWFPQWEEVLNEAINWKDPENPEIYYSYGKLLQLKGQPAEAEAAFLKAFQKDPLNNLKYYYGYAQALRSQGKEIDVSGFLDFLKTYTDLLKKNAHYTILTENPEYANRLYYLLLETEKDAERREKISEAYALFRETWFLENIKFKKIFGGIQEG